MVSLPQEQHYIMNFAVAFLEIKRACLRLRLVRAHLCTDLYENFFGVQLLSYELTFNIS